MNKYMFTVDVEQADRGHVTGTRHNAYQFDIVSNFKLHNKTIKKIVKDIVENQHWRLPVVYQVLNFLPVKSSTTNAEFVEVYHWAS